MKNDLCPINLSSCTSGFIYSQAGAHYLKGISSAARIVLMYDDENEEVIYDEGSGGILIIIPQECDSVKRMQDQEID